MSKPESRFERSQQRVILSPPVKARLDQIRAHLEGERHRQVTYNEVLEILLAHYAAKHDTRDAREAGR